MHTTALSVNINKVALLRNSRHLIIPEVPRAARVCLDAGAQGVTVHPRPDERHIRGSDVYTIAEVLRDHLSKAEFNIEGNPFDENGLFLELVREVRPAQCTLVPDSPDQPTSDHGFDIAADGARLKPVIAGLRALGIRISVFMDADNLEGIRALADLGANRIELYTEPYAAAFEAARTIALSTAATPTGSSAESKLDQSVEEFARAARTAAEVGLGINAGHDLSLENLPRFLNHVPNVLEVSIGHALIGEAIFRGLEQTVRDYLAVIETANQNVNA